jgi:two-component system response regulator HydG
VVGEAEVMRLLEQAIVRVGAFDCPVLVTGETGCGKEEVARAIHAAGSRAGRPFVAVNCGAIVSTLAESQLFGHARGSFTGADASTAGAFRAADRGILFLDEIGEMPLDLQPKLLRALQQREVTPVGATRAIPVDVQVIAATNRDLAVEVAAGRFREDLYYRLNVVNLRLPPLRERLGDVPLLVDSFLGKLSRKTGMPKKSVSPEAMVALETFSWPGNIRQLENELQRAQVMSGKDGAIDIGCLSPSVASAANNVDSRIARAVEPADAEVKLKDALDSVERNMIAAALNRCGGNKSEAARQLGISRSNLIAKAQSFGIE